MVKLSYNERLNRLIKMISLAENIVGNLQIEIDNQKSMLDFWAWLKTMITNLEPPYNKMRNIQDFESMFLEYWNESNGMVTSLFWEAIKANGIDIERKNLIQNVLKKRKITNMMEYDRVVDYISSETPLDEQEKLEKYIGVYLEKYNKSKK